MIVRFFVQVNELGDAYWTRSHGFDGSGGMTAIVRVIVGCSLVVLERVVAITYTAVADATVAYGQARERIVELCGRGVYDSSDPGKNMFYEGGIVVNFFFHGW